MRLFIVVCPVCSMNHPMPYLWHLTLLITEGATESPPATPQLRCNQANGYRLEFLSNSHWYVCNKNIAKDTLTLYKSLQCFWYSVTYLMLATRWLEHAGILDRWAPGRLGERRGAGWSYSRHGIGYTPVLGPARGAPHSHLECTVFELLPVWEADACHRVIRVSYL